MLVSIWKQRRLGTYKYEEKDENWKCIIIWFFDSIALFPYLGELLVQSFCRDVLLSDIDFICFIDLCVSNKI